ncbi:D-arabinono-1,4-lactone oxidase-domain-containing protein [Mycena alexandri]|uniref:D-arabinono-1,4-lactone oxidase n=1 Tax=Mycena alexandri TaxID=1745969 RepID=A0AAD6TB79_9AGAR|nr:D-arabinono-1,4-lactone oxidase-domain-containing protein [Mycena alexandri]
MYLDASYYAGLPRPALVAALEPLVAPPRTPFHNWARTFSCAPLARFRPTTTHHCRLALELARRDARVLRPVGVGHSPSDIACTRDYMLSMVGMSGLVDVSHDPSHPHATFLAGTALTAVHALLAPHGLAMRNLGSISDQSLAGIITTSTHGSGLAFGVMSTHVLALTLLTPDNRIVRCSRGVRRASDPDDWLFPPSNTPLFEATICGLGATGLILSITLELEPRFLLKDTHSVIPFTQFVRQLDDYEEGDRKRVQGLKSRAQHVRFWWFPALGRPATAASTDPASTDPASTATLPVGWTWDWAWDLFAFHLVQLLLLLTRFGRPLAPPVFPFGPRLGAPGPGVTVDESWKVFNIECRYPQHTTEWALPAPRARACLEALGAWLEGEQGAGEGERPHFPIEVRFSAGDDLWLSPAQGGETCWIGVVQYKPYNLPTRYRALFAEFERILAAHGGRPHWAKAHHLDARATRALYPDFGKFLEVVREVDPTGIFRNEYIERHLMGGGGDGREYKARKLPPGEVELFSEFSPAGPRSSEGDSEDAQDADPQAAEPESSVPRRWWSWWTPTPTPTATPRADDWRSDWRLPPPEAELRRRAERRRRLEMGMDAELASSRVKREEEMRPESPLGSESEESDREHELHSESDTDSDSDATLAGSFADLRATSVSPDGGKEKEKGRASLDNTQVDLWAAGDAEKHPARTELSRPQN